LRQRCDVSYHLVYTEGPYYPINFLRNLALSQAVTEFVFLADIDFLPSVGAANSLASAAGSLLLPSFGPRALVVPAFESQMYKLNSLPTSKADLVRRLDLGELFTFRQHDWLAGHIATDFIKWRSSTQPYGVSWSPHYEPYIVVRKEGLPLYDRRFVGFGWNKVAHMLALEAQGLKLLVLPDTFIIHQPHAPSMEIIRWRQEENYRKCLENLKKQFIQELNNSTGIKRETEISQRKRV